jgi:Peptidase family M28
VAAPSLLPDVRALIILVRELLSRPRESGTPESSEARERIAGFLSQQGYHVETQRFSFSTSGLLGFPVFGAGVGWLTLLEIPLLVLPGAPAWAALLVWTTGLLSLATIATGISLGWTVMTKDAREDANLIATRGGKVTRWIVAHHDTKAQGHSMAGRLVAVWTLAAALLLMTGLTVARLWGALPAWLMAAGAAAVLAGGFLAGRGRLKGRSAGARDNGSGLLAALVAAQEIKDPSVGILVTGAEEFGLVGARYFAEKARERVEGTEIINIDTVDDQGAWRLVSHAAGGEDLVRRAESSIGALSSFPIRRHRFTTGIFVDSLPLSRAGGRAITIARLNWGTLRKLHTAGDTLEGLNLDSAVLAGLAVKTIADSRLPTGD